MQKLPTSLKAMAQKTLQDLHDLLSRPKRSQKSRSLVCYQQTRGRKRSTHPPTWHVLKRNRFQDELLTKESKDFLEQSFENQYQNLSSPLKNEPWPRNPWTTNTRRTGLLGIKLGQMPQWTKEGKLTAVTLLQVIDNHVINYVPPEKFKNSAGWKPWWGDNYGVVVVGALSCSPWQFTKAYNNLFAKAGVPPKRKLTRFLVTPDAAIQPGTPLNVLHYKVGDYVNVSAKTIDHGFEGVVKRHGFKGGPASHGSTKFHRRPGAIGGGGNKHSIWKGKKMPGHMGNDWNISKALKIVRINTKYNVLYLKGCNVPGPPHAYVRIYDTLVAGKQHTMPMPTYYPEDSTEEIPEEYFDEELFQFTNDSIVYADEEQ